ncbi:MAG: TonB-dependent receptor [Candidatus Kapaibacterium sp.]
MSNQTMMRLKYFLVLLCLGFLIHDANAQSLFVGKLIEAGSLEPIGAASVKLITTDGKILQTQISHADGSFKLQRLQDGAKLQIHALGFRDTLILFPIQASLTFSLEQSYARGEEVTITAQRHLTALQDVPVSFSVVQAREIAARAPDGLDNALRYIPGVSVTESQVNVRGSSGYARSIGSRVLLLLDGMPFLAADNGDVKFDALPMFDVERIEVIKGAGSALYGSNALGGVINVITRQPTQDLHGAFQTFAGEYDQPIYPQWHVPSVGRRFYTFEGGLSGGINNWGIMASGGYKRNEGYRIGDDYYRWHSFLKLDVPVGGSSKLNISNLLANEDHGGWLYWRSLAEPLAPSDSAAAVNGRIHSFKSNTQIHYTTILGESVLASANANYVHTNFTTDASKIGDPPGAHSSADGINLELTASLPVLEKVFLTSGLTGSYQKVASDLFLDRSGMLFGAFTQAEIKLLDAVTVTAGIRGDYIKYDSVDGAGRLSPKLGLSYALTPELSLRASYGAGFRAPAIGERFIQSKFDIFTVKPNPDLKPERSNSVEAGGTYSDEHWKLDGAVFYSSFSELIEPTFVNGTYIQFQNVTRADLFGHEESVEFFPFDNDLLALRLGYTYIYPKDATTGEVLKFRPRHLLQSRAEIKFAGISISSDFRYVSAYETYDSTLAIQVKDGDQRVPAYVLDARIGYSFEQSMKLPLEITLQAQNVLNYYYVEILGNLAPLRSYSLRLETRF